MMTATKIENVKTRKGVIFLSHLNEGNDGVAGWKNQRKSFLVRYVLLGENPKWPAPLGELGIGKGKDEG